MPTIGRRPPCRAGCPRRAANPDTRSAFGLWQDSNVRNMGAATEQPADRIACIWKLVEAEDGKVKDVWFLRQMTTAEREHRVGASSCAMAAWAGAQHAASHCSEPEAALVPGQCACAWALLTPRTVAGGCS